MRKLSAKMMICKNMCLERRKKWEKKANTKMKIHFQLSSSFAFIFTSFFVRVGCGVGVGVAERFS